MQDDDRLYELVKEGDEDVVLFSCRYLYDLLSVLVESDWDVLYMNDVPSFEKYRVVIYEGSKQNPIERLDIGMFISENITMYKELLTKK